MKLSKFAGDVAVNFVSSAAALAIGFTQALVLPAFLSLQQFGLWRLFFLYVGYAGFANLGFADGVLLRWSAQDVGQTRKELPMALSYLLWQQIALLVPIGLLLISRELRPGWLIISILAGMVAVNFLTVARFFLQASLRFTRLSVINVAVSLTFVFGIAVLIATGWLDTKLLVVLYLFSVLVGFVLMIILESVQLREKVTPKRRHILHFGATLTKSGFFVLMGNVGLILIVTLDKLVISWTQSIEAFAIYSFAGTAIALVYQGISTVSEVIFPHLMKLEQTQRDSLYHFAKHSVIVVGGLALALFFPLRFLVLRYYPEYSASLAIMRVLLLGTCFGAVFRLIQANYFKARFQQRTFFAFGLVINLGFLMAALLAARKGELVYFAWISLLASSVWYLSNDIYLHRAMKMGLSNMLRGLLAIFGFGVWFWFVSSWARSAHWEMLVYLSGAVGLAAVVLWSDRERLRFLWSHIAIRNTEKESTP